MKKLFGVLAVLFLFASCATTLKVPEIDVYGENIPTAITITQTDCKISSLKKVSDYGAIKAAEENGYDSIICFGQTSNSQSYTSLNSYDTYNTTDVDLYSNYKKVGTAKVQTKETHYYTSSHSRDILCTAYAFYHGDVKSKYKEAENYQILYVKDKEHYKGLAKKAYVEEYDLGNWILKESILSILTCFLFTPSIPIEITRYNLNKPK